MNRRDALERLVGFVGAASAAGLNTEGLQAQIGIAPDIPGPDPSPHAPSFHAPALSCDAHCHVFGPVDRYPYAASRPYTPPEAPLAMFQALHRRLGIDRAVLVNATTYGNDNRVVLDAIAASRGRYRGIGNVDEGMSDRELADLAAGGLDGCRFTFLSRLGGRPDMRVFDRIVERIAPLGWHVDLYVAAKDLGELAPRLRRLPVPYVIDHMGLVEASAVLEQPAFQSLLALVARDEKCWVKITGPERISKTGPPFHDAVPFARRLIEAAPDRVLWGTDWPHPNVPVMPNDGDLVDLLPLYAPDPSARRRLLVENPARLFKF
jgi:2-pyrone-4,6-dicarboxylate lactonase